MKISAVSVAALTLLSLGCNNNSATTSPTALTTQTVSLVLAPLGETTETIQVAQAGTLSATLTSAGPPSTIELGFGVGVPRSSGATASGCLLTTSIVTQAGPAAQIALPVDPGTYCVAVYDPGTLTTQSINFTVTLVHP